MSRDSVGRRAGHHITEGQSWRWQEFGGKLMLVTDGGGADIVLSVAQLGSRAPWQLVTCSPDGRVVSLKPESPLGLVLTAVPDLVEVAGYIAARDDRPKYLPRLQAALAKAGML